MAHKDLNHDNKSMKDRFPMMYSFVFLPRTGVHIVCFSMRKVMSDSNFPTYFKATIDPKVNIYANSIFGLCVR